MNEPTHNTATTSKLLEKEKLLLEQENALAELTRKMAFLTKEIDRQRAAQNTPPASEPQKPELSNTFVGENTSEVFEAGKKKELDTLLGEIAQEEQELAIVEIDIPRIRNKARAEQALEEYKNFATEVAAEKLTGGAAAIRADFIESLKIPLAELADRVNEKNLYKWFAAQNMSPEHRKIVGIDRPEITDETISTTKAPEEVAMVTASNKDTITFTETGFCLQVEGNDVEGGARENYVDNSKYSFVVKRPNGVTIQGNLKYAEAMQKLVNEAQSYQHFFLKGQFTALKDTQAYNDETIKKLLIDIEEKEESYREKEAELARDEEEKITKPGKAKKPEIFEDEEGEEEKIPGPIEEEAFELPRVISKKGARKNIPDTDENINIPPPDTTSEAPSPDTQNISPPESHFVNDDVTSGGAAMHGAPDLTYISHEPEEVIVDEPEPIPEEIAPIKDILPEREVVINEFGFPEGWAEEESIEALEEIREKINEMGEINLPKVKKLIGSEVAKVYDEYSKYDNEMLKFNTANPINGGMMEDFSHYGMARKEKLEYFNKRFPQGMGIRGTREHLKWSAILDYELWVIIDQHLTLASIRERGGLSAKAIMCIRNAIVEGHPKRGDAFSNQDDIINWLRENDMIQPEPAIKN